VGLKLSTHITTLPPHLPGPPILQQYCMKKVKQSQVVSLKEDAKVHFTLLRNFNKIPQLHLMYPTLSFPPQDIVIGIMYNPPKNINSDKY
jgi:hypothetical protein